MSRNITVLGGGWQKRGLKANPSAPNLWEPWKQHVAAPPFRCSCSDVHGWVSHPIHRVTSFFTARGAWVCYWPRPCQKILKRCVPIYACMRLWVRVSLWISTHPCPHSSPGEEPELLPSSALCTSPRDGYSNLLTSCSPPTHTPLQEHFSYWCFPLPRRFVTFLW